MKRLLIALSLILFAESSARATHVMTYDDGLPQTPTSFKYEDAKDRAGRTYGTYKYEYFYIDINKDGRPDRITRGRYTSPTGEYTFYKIERQDDNRKYTNLPLSNFRTVESGDCFFTIYRFYFEPRFQIHKISRQSAPDCIAATAAGVEVFELITDEWTRTQNITVLPTRDVRLVD